MKNFTWNEISAHNSPEECWIVVDGIAYDITLWIDGHPGGDILAVLAGEDASAMFHSCHLRDIIPMLEKFKMGEVLEYQPDFEVVNDDFLVALKRRVYKFFIDQGVDYHDTQKNRRTILFTSIFLLACWGCMYFLSPWGFLASIPMGLATCSLIGSFGHEHIHGNLFKRVEKRQLFYHVKNDILWGLFIPFMPERFFQYEHIKHHLYPMNPQHDYDVFALKNLVRLSPDLKIMKYQSLQHIYAPLVYGFYIFLQILGGYTTSFFSKRNLLKDKGVLPNIIGTSLVAFIFHIAVPIYLTDVWWVLLCASSYFFTWQAAIYISSGVPHMTSAAAAYEKSNSWAQHVCKMTKNLKCGNWFYDWLTGGLNYHLAHHLLPSIPREHLPKINHIVEQTCNEFGYPYFTYTDFGSYYRDHYKFLFELGGSRNHAQVFNE
jgi:linoleoyl-CoA desaturase